MAYLYTANLDSFDRRDQLEIMLDNGDSAILKRGSAYDLTAAELARARKYVVMTLVTGPATADPTGVVYLPLKGNPANGQIPLFDAAQGVFIPGSVAGIGGASAVPFTPTGTIASTNVQAAIAEVASEAGGGGSASTMSFAPTGTVVATNVQAAIAEVSGDVSTVGSDVAVIKAAPLNAHHPEYDAGSHRTSAQNKAALQLLLTNAAAVASGNEGPAPVYLPPDDYLTDSGINLPALDPYPSAWSKLRIFSDGGATLRTTGAGVILQRALPTTQASASQQATSTTFIEGIRFVGNGTTGQGALKGIFGYGSIIRECSFLEFDTACEFIFSLMLSVQNCTSYWNRSYAYWIHTGVDFATSTALWTGATVASTAGNVEAFQSCRDYCFAGQLASWRIDGTNIALRDCISEGNNPQRDIIFNHQGNARIFQADRLWSENQPTIERIYAPSLNRTLIRGLQLPTGAVRVLNTEGSTSGSEVRMEDIPYWPAGATLRHGTDANLGRWVFDNVYNGQDMLDPTIWDTTGSYVVPNGIEQRQGTSAIMGSAIYPAVRGKRVGLEATEEIRLAGGTTGVRIGTIPSANAAIKGHLSGTAAADLASIAAGGFASVDVTVTGAALGDTCYAGVNSSSWPDGFTFNAYVKAADTVRVTAVNHTGSAFDPGNQTYRADVWKH